MTQPSDGGGAAFNAYVTTRETDIPHAVSAPVHARAQADILADDLAKLEAKVDAQTAEVSGRLAILRDDLTRARSIQDAGSTDYPGIAGIVEEIALREAKAAAELVAIDANLNSQREAVKAAQAEADRLEAEAPPEES